MKRSIPIKTTLKPKVKYNHKKKKNDPYKALMNQIIMYLVINLNDFYNELQLHFTSGFKALVLDGENLGTTNTLIKGCNLSVENIDIVSDELLFKPVRKVKTGRLSDMKLSNFLDTENEVDKYDIAVLDFCNNWGTETITCVERLFEKKLLDSMSILTITCCFRNKEGTSYTYEDWYECRYQVTRIAYENGYHVNDCHSFSHYDDMFCLFFKVVYPTDVMDRKFGIKVTRKKETPTHWFAKTIPNLPELVPKSHSK